MLDQWGIRTIILQLLLARNNNWLMLFGSDMLGELWMWEREELVAIRTNPRWSDLIRFDPLRSPIWSIRYTLRSDPIESSPIRSPIRYDPLSDLLSPIPTPICSDSSPLPAPVTSPIWSSNRSDLIWSESLSYPIRSQVPSALQSAYLRSDRSDPLCSRIWSEPIQCALRSGLIWSDPLRSAIRSNLISSYLRFNPNISSPMRFPIRYSIHSAPLSGPVPSPIPTPIRSDLIWSYLPRSPIRFDPIHCTLRSDQVHSPINSYPIDPLPMRSDPIRYVLRCDPNRSDLIFDLLCSTPVLSHCRSKLQSWAD